MEPRPPFPTLPGEGDSAPISKSPRLVAGDPLARFEAEKAEIQAALEAACNAVGENVVIGTGVVLWGGKGEDVAGIRLGNGVRLYDQCRLVLDRISRNSGVSLGERVALNFGCTLDGSGGIIVGPGTIMGPNVMIVSSAHIITPDLPVQKSGKTFAPVTIGRNVWIGGNASILAGVTIGDGAVIGAGSVVTHDIPSNVVAMGSPARVSRAI